MQEVDTRPRLTRNIGLGLALSLVIHLCAGAALVVGNFEPIFDPLAADRPRPDENQPLRLGIDRSQAATINWVGFEQPTEHSAEHSTVEQAAVTPVVGRAEAASEDQPSPESRQSDAQAAQPEPQPEQPAPPEAPAETVAQVEPIPEMPLLPTEMLGPIQAAPEAPSALLDMEPGEILRPPPDMPAQEPQPAAEPSETPPTPETQPAAAAQPAPAQPAASAATPSGTPGIKDEREADASAISMTMSVRPGRPVAAEGLQINTVRPQYGVTVRAISRPRNPVVLIQFDRAGKVRRAEWVVRDGKRLDTGSLQVDGPLMDAIYRWTAKGVALEPLGRDDTLGVEIRLLINGSS